MDSLASILAIAIVAGGSLVYGTIGEIFTERSGILNLALPPLSIHKTRGWASL
jgi:ABC-type uncharacterized transport system permease subunit